MELKKLKAVLCNDVFKSTKLTRDNLSSILHSFQVLSNLKIAMNHENLISKIETHFQKSKRVFILKRITVILKCYYVY